MSKTYFVYVESACAVDDVTTEEEAKEQAREWFSMQLEKRNLEFTVEVEES